MSQLKLRVNSHRLKSNQATSGKKPDCAPLHRPQIAQAYQLMIMLETFLYFIGIAVISWMPENSPFPDLLSIKFDVRFNPVTEVLKDKQINTPNPWKQLI